MVALIIYASKLMYSTVFLVRLPPEKMPSAFNPRFMLYALLIIHYFRAGFSKVLTIDPQVLMVLSITTYFIYLLSMWHLQRSCNH